MLISLIVALAIIAGTAFLLLRGLHAVRASKKAGVAVAFSLAVALGLAAGVWLGILHQFQLNERVRVQGMPVPLVVFLLEDHNWTDFVKPLPVGFVCMAANALFPVGLLGIVCVLVSRRLLRQRAHQSDSASRPA